MLTGISRNDRGRPFYRGVTLNFDVDVAADSFVRPTQLNCRLEDGHRHQLRGRLSAHVRCLRITLKQARLRSHCQL